MVLFDDYPPHKVRNVHKIHLKYSGSWNKMPERKGCGSSKARFLDVFLTNMLNEPSLHS